MEFFWLLVPLLICVEIAKKIDPGKNVKISLNLFRKIIYVFSYKRVSDRWKEKVLLRYACKFFKLNFKFFIQLVLIISPFAFVFLIDEILKSEFNQALFDIYFYLVSIPVVIVYIKIRSVFHERG